MDSDLQQHYQLQHFQDHHLNSRTRYRSAPSSYLDSIDAPSSVIVSNDKSDYNQPRPLSPETESIFAKFLSSVNDGNDNKLCGIPENYPVQAEYKEALVKQETQPINQHSSYPSPPPPPPPPVIYSPNKPPLAKNNLNHSPTSSNSSMDSTPFRAPSSRSMDQQLKMGAGGANGPNSNSNSQDASNNALTLLGPFRTPGSSMAMDSMPTPQIIRKIPGVGGGAGTSTSAPTPNPTMKSRCPFGAPGSMAMDSMPQQMKIGVGGMNGPMNQQQIKMGGGNGSHLVRHSSLPAGFLSDINLDHASGFQSPSSGLADCRSFNNNNGTITNSKGSSSSSSSTRKRFPISSWDDSMLLLSDYNLGNLEDDDDHKAFPDHELESSDHQNEAEAEATARINRPPTVLLAHHLSLPKTALEKVLTLQFQETTTPCQIRAKRGMATHPRSIAERVRRTRISERMRKLQDLVPYMDKQTNTADMLDLAVEYIKDLQKQVKILADKRAKCCCSG